MDGYPLSKKNNWRGQLYSDTRFYVIQWLERELPLISGVVLNVSAGGWPIPKLLLNKTKVTKYVTCDKKMYGDSKNPVDVYCDVNALPNEWTNVWDCVLNNQSFECYENPFKAMSELYRVLKPGGILLLDSPWNYVWFGKGSHPESLKKKNPVKDYWRISSDGWRLLTKDFKSVTIEGFGGTENSRYVYCIKAIK